MILTRSFWEIHKCHEASDKWPKFPISLTALAIRNISHSSLIMILFSFGSNLSWVILQPFVSSPPSISPTGCSDSHGLRNFYDEPNYSSKFLSHPSSLYSSLLCSLLHPQCPATGRRCQKQGCYYLASLSLLETRRSKRWIRERRERNAIRT